MDNGTYVLQNKLYDDDYASYTPFDVTSDKATVSSVWTSKPMQWYIDPSDQGGSYMYVPQKPLRLRLFITIMIRISDQKYTSFIASFFVVKPLMTSIMDGLRSQVSRRTKQTTVT